MGNLNTMQVVAKNLRVLANADTNAKFTLLQGLKQCGQNVAYFGHCEVDTPYYFTHANVGFSCGSGT